MQPECGAPRAGPLLASAGMECRRFFGVGIDLAAFAEQHSCDGPFSGGRPLGAVVDDVEKANEQPRCIKCYSADVTCHEIQKPLSMLERTCSIALLTMREAARAIPAATNGTTRINAMRQNACPNAF